MTAQQRTRDYCLRRLDELDQQRSDALLANIRSRGAVPVPSEIRRRREMYWRVLLRLVVRL